MKNEVQAVRNWNKIIRLIMELRDEWRRHKDFMMSLPDLADIPGDGSAKYITMPFYKRRFRFAIPDIIEHGIRIGGLENFLVDIKYEEAPSIMQLITRSGSNKMPRILSAIDTKQMVEIITKVESKLFDKIYPSLYPMLDGRIKQKLEKEV